MILCIGLKRLTSFLAGALKHCLPHLHRRISRTLTAYYGSTSTLKPTFSLRAPHPPYYSPPNSPELPSHQTSDPDDHHPPPPGHQHQTQHPHHLHIILISQIDGRQTLVDLTKTLTEMSQASKLSPGDISSELIDAEIKDSVMSEPDLILLFGERIVLGGYPPWQARLSEMFCVRDWGGGVSYQVFLRGCLRYGKAEFRLGS